MINLMPAIEPANERPGGDAGGGAAEEIKAILLVVQSHGWKGLHPPCEFRRQWRSPGAEDGANLMAGRRAVPWRQNEWSRLLRLGRSDAVAQFQSARPLRNRGCGPYSADLRDRRLDLQWNAIGSSPRRSLAARAA